MVIDHLGSSTLGFRNAVTRQARSHDWGCSKASWLPAVQAFDKRTQYCSISPVSCALTGGEELQASVCTTYVTGSDQPHNPHCMHTCCNMIVDCLRSINRIGMLSSPTWFAVATIARVHVDDRCCAAAVPRHDGRGWPHVLLQIPGKVQQSKLFQSKTTCRFVAMACHAMAAVNLPLVAAVRLALMRTAASCLRTPMVT